MSPARVALGRASIGVSAHLGWAATAVIAVGKGGPRVLRTDRIETADPGDRECMEPFHVAGGFHGLERVPRPSDPAATVQRGLRKQRRHTAKALARIEKALASEKHHIAWAAILVSRGRPAESLEKAIGSHTQIHIEEGIAVRESIRQALSGLCGRVHDIDQKGVGPIASRELGAKEEALLARLGDTRPENGGAWRKEEKLAALAAWIAWSRGAGR